MKKKVYGAAFLVLLAALSSWGFASFWKFSHSAKIIKVSGNIEGTDVHLSFRTAGKIVELLKDEGDVVKVGELVARLDTDELSKSKDQAEASLRSALQTYELNDADYKRAQNLFLAGSFSAQKRDSYKTAAETSKANVDALQAAYDLAVTRLGFTDLCSTLDGFVITKNAEAGEVVQTGAPVFVVNDLTDIWLTAYINEGDLGKVRLNQSVEVKTDSYPDKIYTGRISFVSQETEFTPKQIQTTEERVKLVYRIKIKIDNKNLELKPGMPADGYIQLM